MGPKQLQKWIVVCPDAVVAAAKIIALRQGHRGSGQETQE
jgi:hypothetical protein